MAETRSERAGVGGGDGAAVPGDGFARERSDPRCMAAAEVHRLLRGAPWRRLAVLGDSLAEGLGDPLVGYAHVYWPERVADALRRVNPDLAYVNLGRRDLRAAEIRATQLEPALEFRPDLVAVTGGGNDLMAHDWNPEAVESELDALVAALRERGADVITWTLWDITRAFPDLASTPLGTRLAQLNASWRAIAHRHRTLHIEQEDDPVAAERDVYSADLKHSTSRGHAIVAAGVFRRLGQHLREAGGA